MNKDLELALYASMYRIRAVEEAIATHYPEQEMRCPVHLSIGQEAIPAVFSSLIQTTDYAISTHRGHAHYLAKGGNLNAMIAEIYGKVTGCSRGKGGSMHLIDLAVNFMGTSAIVGNSIPVGVGLGLSAQLKDTDQISCVFLGDGAVEEGVFYESLNFSAVRKLPILFICENNLYSVYSPLSVRQPTNRVIADMAQAIGVDAFRASGSNLLECYQLLQSSITKIRSGGGPIFLEFSTYRWREHCGHDYDNHIGYRSEEEFLEWKAKDPLNTLELKLVNLEGSYQKHINNIQKDVALEVENAFAFAASSDFPPLNEAYEGVYA